MDSDQWPFVTGEMADRIRALDWAETPLGPAAAWPPSLRTATAMMLAAPQVASLAVGSGRDLLYNDHAARLYGTRHPSALGRPLAETFGTDFLKVAGVYDRVFAGESLYVAGQPLVLDPGADPEIFDAWLSPVRGEDGQIVAAYMTGVAVGAERRAADALRARETERAYVLRLSDAIRPLTDADAIQAVAARVLGEELGAARAYFVEFDEARRLATVHSEYVRSSPISLLGEHDYDGFGAVLAPMRAGIPVLMNDVETDPGIDAADLSTYRARELRAFLALPLIRHARLICAMCVVDDTPRSWSAREARLAEETVERTWAAVERARAEADLREGEERMRQFGEATRDILWLRDAETLRLTYVTAAFETIYGSPRAKILADDGFRAWLEIVLPADRDRAIAAIRRVRSGESVTFGYRVRRPTDGTVRWLRNNAFPIHDEHGRVKAIGGVGHDETALRETERRFRTLVEGMPQLIWRGIAGGDWTWASPQWTEYTGQSCEQSLHWGWLDPIHPDDRAVARAMWRRAEAEGGFEVEYRIRDEATGSYRWFKTRAAPVLDETGAIVEWLGTSTDIHDLRALQEQQQVLVAELQHRTRNLMAVVRSIANKTLRTSVDLDDFGDRYDRRLAALARTQGLLSRLANDDRVTFGELIRTEMAAIDADPAKLQLDGPEAVALRSSTVQTLALAIHELATNAVKYGALAQPDGRLTVRWRASEGEGTPTLRVDWIEAGVTFTLADARHRGQGRDLIERALPYQLGARTTYLQEEDGIRCAIELPISAVSVAEPA